MSNTSMASVSHGRLSIFLVFFIDQENIDLGVVNSIDTRLDRSAVRNAQAFCARLRPHMRVCGFRFAYADSARRAAV